MFFKIRFLNNLDKSTSEQKLLIDFLYSREKKNTAKIQYVVLISRIRTSREAIPLNFG